MILARVIVPATLDHVYWIGPNMRQADVDEIAASVGYGPVRGTLDSFERSAIAWTGLVDEEPVCIFGVSPVDILAGVGCPWLLGTEQVVRYAVTFLRLNKGYVARMLSMFPHLENFVDARNAHSIRWLKWLGFQFDPAPVPYGVSKLPFYRFHMEGH
jgi:hypothetical protein